MATTVGASLKLFDRFTATLTRAEQGMQSVIRVAERLKQELQSQITLNIDMAGALAHIETVKESIRTAGGSSAINVVLNATDVTAQIAQIQTDIRTGLAAAVVSVTLDTVNAMSEASLLGGKLQAAIGSVSADVTLNVPNAATVQAQLAAITSSASATMNVNVVLNTASTSAQLTSLMHSLAGASITVGVDMPNAGTVKAQLMSLIHGLGMTGILIDVRLNTAKAITQAFSLRTRLESILSTVVADIQLNLPPALTSLLTELNRLVTDLIAAVVRLETLLRGGGGGGGGGPGGGGPGGLLGQLKGIVAAYLSIAAAKKLVESTIGAGMEQIKMQDMFKARTGDDQVGAAMFDHFKQNALKAGVDVNEGLKSTLSFFSVSQNTDQLDKMNNLAQRLNAFDSAGNGMEGAAFALKEAMSGDIVSLAERFNVSKSAIREFKIDDLGKSGNVTEFLSQFDKLLESQKMGQAAFETMLKSPAKQAEQLGNNIKSAMADAGQGAVAALLPIITMLNSAFQAGKFAPFFTALQTGLRIATLLVVGLVSAAMWLWDVIQSNWSLISSILAGIAAVVIASLIPSLWAMVIAAWAQVPPALAIAAAWLAVNWPILLIGIALAALIYILQQCGVSFADVAGFISGLFMMLVGHIWNQIALLWNVFATFAEFLINLFIDPTYAIKKLFYDLVKTFGGNMYTMLQSVEGFAGGFMSTILEGINGVLKGFNWLSDAINDMTGVDLGQAKMFDTQNIHAVSDGIKGIMDQLKEPVSDKGVISIARMDPKNLKNEFDYGFNGGSNFVNGLSFSMPGSDQSALGNWNANTKPNIGSVDEVGKIKDKVDISSEDLKVMRDLAEMKSIQNFVTLTPTVQVQTGDINNGADVDSIIKRIGDHLEEQFASSAEGTYA
jgi:hypothetical protein